MQKLISIMVLISLFLSISTFVVAEQARSGVVYDIEIPLTTTISKTINEGDVLRFNFPVRVYDDPETQKGNYKIEERSIKLHIREVTEKGIVRTTFFIQGEEVPVYLDVSNKRILKLDFEKDGIEDMAVAFVVGAKQVTVGLKRNPAVNYCNDNGVCEDDEDQQCGDCTGKITSDVVKETNKEFISGYGKYIVGIVAGLIFFLITYFFMVYKKN